MPMVEATMAFHFRRPTCATLTYGQVLYVVGCVYYFGLDKTKTYFSDLCVVWAPKAPQDFQPCDEPERNRAD